MHSQRVAARLRRRKSIRKRVVGSKARPRMAVFRSARHIYVQLVDDVDGVTLVSASTLDLSGSEVGDKKSAARAVGELVAERALAKGVSEVVFDRGGFVYHGRVASLADGARAGGLLF
jgi:large subunit ribosomal protein L18